MKCEICGAPATHLCRTCGKWLCNSGDCAKAAAGESIVKHPIKTAAQVIRHPVETAGVARRILLPPTPTHGGR